MNICIIPARGGSKRIPGKNSKLFLNESIIIYPIRAAIESGIFDKIIIATNDMAIWSICIKKFGRKIAIYRRNEKNAIDTALTEDIIAEVIDENKIYGKVWLIYPTSVFITAEQLIAIKGVHLPAMEYGDYDLIMSADDGVDTAQIYVFKTSIFRNKWKFKIEMRDHWKRRDIFIPGAIDINTPEDWKRAEKIWEEMYNK